MSDGRTKRCDISRSSSNNFTKSNAFGELLHVFRIVENWYKDLLYPEAEVIEDIRIDVSHSHMLRKVKVLCRHSLLLLLYKEDTLVPHWAWPVSVDLKLYINTSS